MNSISSGARSAAVRRVRFAVLGAWTCLLCLVWSWRLSQEFTGTAIAWAAAFSLPLLAPLPGLWRGSRYTHAWATLCVLPYFIVGMTESIANHAVRMWAGLMLVTSLALFIALIAQLRVTREQRAD